MKVSHFIGASTLAIAANVQAADIRDQMSIQTGKAELVIPQLPPHEIANKVKEAVSQFAIPANINFRPIPSPLPSKPGTPVEKQTIIGGSPAVEYICEGAYAEITKTPPPVQNAFYFNREALHACLYAFDGGVKVNLYFHVIKKTESLTGSIFNGITKAIRGTDGERITGQLNENITEIKKLIPTLLVAQIQAPGVPSQEPDKDAVSKLIPPLQGNELTTNTKSANPSPVASPNQASQSAKPEVDLSFIGARKELTAMGFKFYDQDQFVDAARRNDSLTLRLFLAAAAIRPSKPDSKGETALSFLPKNHEMRLTLEVFINAEKEGKYPPTNISELISSK